MKTRVKTRLATIDDHKQCLNIMKKYSYTDAYGHIFYSSSERYARGDIMVAVEGNKIVGVACVSYRKRRYQGRPQAANLQYIAVDRPKMGVGKKLIQEVQARAPDNRVELKVEENNKNAVKAYRKIGFKVKEKFRSKDNKRMYLLMVKDTYAKA